MASLPSVKQIAGLASKPVGAASQLASRPIGLGWRRLRTPHSLHDKVDGRVVMVTGASSGIGEASALRLGGAGATVVLVARSADKLKDLAGRIADAGGEAHVHPTDLTDLDAIDALATEVLEEHGGVDALVNSAGRSIRRSVELSYDRFHDYQRTMQLNYFAPVRLILRFLPGMRERESGHVVNISSAGVQTRVPRFAAYIASKAALDAFSDAVQAEVLDDGVRFTTLHMPLVRTPMIAPTGIYKSFPALTPEEAANLVAQAIVFRPRRMGPPFGHFAAMADAVSPEVMDFVRNRGFHMFPDSKAARGERRDGGEPDRDPGRTGAAFARATRGVHW